MMNRLNGGCVDQYNDWLNLPILSYTVSFLGTVYIAAERPDLLDMIRIISCDI